MFCHNCGKKLEDGTKHCPYCGVKQYSSMQDETVPAVEESAGKQGKKKFPVAAVAGIAAAVVVVLLLVMQMTGGKYTMKPVDYVVLQVSGLDTEGTASVTFDAARFLEDIEEKKALTEREQDEILYLLSDVKRDFSLSKNSQLSNGDEIRVESNLDKKLLQKYGITLKNGSMKQKVENLPEIQEISLDAYASFAFSGFEGCGYGYVSVDFDKLREDIEARIREIDDSQDAEDFIENELYYYLDGFTAEPSSLNGLSGGEKVTARISVSPSEISKYGIRFVEQDLTAEVEGLIPTETVTLTDYLDGSFEGYNGAGSAKIVLQEEQLTADLQELFESQKRGAYGAMPEEADVAQEVSLAVSGIRDSWKYAFTTELDRNSGLSNGDEVTITAAADEEQEYLSSFGIYLEGGTKKITAAGLQEPEEIDLAEALTVTFSGVCPNVYVERSVNYEVPYYYMTSLSDLNYDEKILAWNGDVYSGEITYDAQELLENGYVVANNQYSYTISGLNSYRLSVEKLDEESLQEIRDDMKEKAVSRIAENMDWIKNSLGSEEKWVLWKDGSVELYSGQTAYVSDESHTQNRIYLVYRGTLPVKKLDHTVVPREVYFVACCYNVQETPEGRLIYEDYDTSLFLSEAEAGEYIRSDHANLGDQTEITILNWSEKTEETEIPLNGDEAVSGEAVLEETIQPVELKENVDNLSANRIDYEGHTYARFDMNLTWDLAKSFCETAGGHLATITSDRENAVIQYLLQDAPYDRYWLGASDAEWEGGWQWVTGEAFDWTDWDSSQPDNYSDNEEEEENYLEIGSKFSNHWNDNYGGYMEGGFILEMEPAVTAEEAGADLDAQAEEQGEEGNQDGKTGKTVYLTDLALSYASQCGLQEQITDPYGDMHFYSLYLNATERGTAYYDLDGAWSELSGNISTWTDADSDGVYELFIWGDDKLLFSLYDYRKSDSVVPFRLNVEGVETLSIQTRNRGAESGGYLFLNECKLHSDGTETGITGTKKSLTDLKPVDSTEYFDYLGKGLPTDSRGMVYRELNQFLASDNGRAVWRLEGRYQTLEGTVFAGENAYNKETSVSMEILADGEQVFLAENLDVFQGTVPISVDLTGKEILEIRTWMQEESGDRYIYLGDTVLTGSKTNTKAKAEAEGPKFPELDPVISGKAAKMLTSGNYRYYRFEEPLTWQQAAAFCRAAGGTLARPDNAVKNAAIQSLVSDGNCTSYWMYGQRETVASGEEEVDSTKGWRWSDGTEFGEYQNWSGSQPDNYEGKEYLLCMYRDGTWNDASAEAMTGFVMELSAVSGLLSQDDALLTDFEWTDSQYCEAKDVIAQSALYPAAVQMDASNNAKFSILLDGGYTSFQGTVHPYVNAADDANFQFGIFGDGVLLYDQRDLKKTDGDAAFSVDVTGVKQLTVAACNNGGYSDGFLFLLNGHLKPDAEGEKSKISRLGDLVTVDAVESSTGDTMFWDVYGQLHDRYTALNAGAGSSVLYNLEGKYSSLSGSFTAGGDTLLGNPARITFYADGTAVYEIAAFEKSEGAVSFEIDLTGVGTLEIRAEAEAEGSTSWIYLTDDQLFGI
ncbi:MAG: NPCBM/NEW2 domain-containing protein [Lachnospiraceae bacterium]|nr:NPCBM/NEW2 domain-containing protein [Lachnospiraceae bacterium]